MSNEKNEACDPGTPGPFDNAQANALFAAMENAAMVEYWNNDGKKAAFYRWLDGTPQHTLVLETIEHLNKLGFTISPNSDQEGKHANE